MIASAARPMTASPRKLGGAGSGGPLRMFLAPVAPAAHMPPDAEGVKADADDAERASDQEQATRRPMWHHRGATATAPRRAAESGPSVTGRNIAGSW